jgi:hypothetical protein
VNLFKLSVFPEYFIALKLFIEFLPLHILLNFLRVSLLNYTAALGRYQEEIDGSERWEKNYWEIFHINLVMLLAYRIVLEDSWGLKTVLNHHIQHQSLIICQKIAVTSSE